MSLSEMSNPQLIAHLRRSLTDRSWKPIEFVEAERRGEDCLDSDPELAEAFRAAYEPTRQMLVRLSGQSTPPVTAEPTRFSDIPDIAGDRHSQLLAVLERSDSRLAAIETHTGRDWVFWVQFSAVMLGVVIAVAALFR